MFCPTVTLGLSGLEVPKLIFGTEHIIHLSPEKGGALLDRARRDLGLFHWDTAPAYQSHPHVASGLRYAGRENVFVTSKIPDQCSEGASARLDSILEELATEYLDLCLLHNVKEDAFASHRPAVEFLKEAKCQGRVRALGISSHVPSVIRESLEEPSIEVVCAPLNLDGSRIEGGTLEDMCSALEDAYARGKGVYVIKVLGVGDLVAQLGAAIEFAMEQPFVHACNIGMKNMDEACMNLEIIQKLTGEDTNAGNTHRS